MLIVKELTVRERPPLPLNRFLCLHNVLEQTMFISKLCDTLKSMPKSVDSDLLLSAWMHAHLGSGIPKCTTL